MAKNKIVQGIPSQTDRQIVPLNLRLVDLSGGQNSNTNPALLEDKEAAISQGVDYRQRGTVRAQKGRRNRYALPVAVYTTNGLGSYYKSDGSSFFVMSIGNTLYYDRAILDFVYDTSSQFSNGTVNYYINSSGNSVPAVFNSGDQLSIVNTWKSCLLATASGEPYPYVPISAGTGITVGYEFAPVKSIAVRSITAASYHAGINTTEHVFKVSLWRVSDKERLFSQTVTAKSWNHADGQVDGRAVCDPPVVLEAGVSYRLSCYTVTGEMYEWGINATDTQNYMDFTWESANNKSSAGDVFPDTTSRAHKYLLGLYLREYDIIDIGTQWKTDTELATGTLTNCAVSGTGTSAKVAVPVGSFSGGSAAALVTTGEQLTNVVRYDTNKIKLALVSFPWSPYIDMTWADFILA